MRFLPAIFLVFLSVHAGAQQSLPAIGLWREHLPYGSAIDLAAGDGKIYCATPYSLFTVNSSDKSIERMSRVTGLTETGISAINYNAATGKLFIAYSTSNIDIIYKEDIFNVPDIKRDNITGDKHIYNIYSFQQNYYLSTGLGVIVVDGDRYEVKDSWFIGNGGNQVKVNGFASDGTFFYAATEEGLKRIATNSPDPANYLNWQMLGGSNGLPGGACQDVLTVSGKLIVQKNDSLYILNNNNWSLFYTDGAKIVNSNSSANKIILCQSQANGQGRLTILNPDATIARVITPPSPVSVPRKGIIVNDDPWLADQQEGLVHFTTSSSEKYIPNSPASTANGDLLVYNRIFYAAAGEVDAGWNYQHNDKGIFIFKEGEWTTINHNAFSLLDSLLDFITLAIDPRDETLWAGSFGGGLLHIKKDGSFEIFKQNTIGQAIGDPQSYRVSGLAFDAENNLWISNFAAAQPLLARKKDGTLVKFSTPFSIAGNSLAQIIVDDNNYKWIQVAKTGTLICFDDGSTVENTGDDKWKLYSSGTGNGNLPAGEVLCLAKDKSGYIWVGTANGIGVIQCTQDVFTASACDAIWPIVQEGNFAGYLFNGEEVKSIAVDGADRKWIATPHGAWLMSPEGEKSIYHFTEENSPLLSNDVRKIAIDGQTGEVFFATAKGICSFRGTATGGTQQNENVLVFPNPVPPGYTGTIGIRGLSNNAIVKITEMDGRLIYQARALGGQAVWDGRDYKGRRISSGVYLVLVSDDGSSSKKEKAAAKIVFLNK